MSVEFETISGYDRTEVLAICDDALAIVRELEPDEDLRQAVFSAAVQMLGARQRIPKIPEALRGLVQMP